MNHGVRANRVILEVFVFERVFSSLAPTTNEIQLEAHHGVVVRTVRHLGRCLSVLECIVDELLEFFVELLFGVNYIAVVQMYFEFAYVALES